MARWLLTRIRDVEGIYLFSLRAQVEIQLALPNLLEILMRVQAVGIQRRSSSLMELCHATLPHCSSMLNSTYAFRLALLRTSGNNEASSFKTVTHRSFRSGLCGQRARYNPP